MNSRAHPSATAAALARYNDRRRGRVPRLDDHGERGRHGGGRERDARLIACTVCAGAPA